MSSAPALTMGWLATRPTTMPSMRPKPTIRLRAQPPWISRNWPGSTRRSITARMSMGSPGSSGTSWFMSSSGLSSISTVGRCGGSSELLDGR